MQNELATVDAPTTSPSGRLQLRILRSEEGNLKFHSFQILDKLGKEVYRPDEQFDVRHQLYFLWDDHDDVVWVYSGDVGTFFWQKNPDSQEWIKKTYARNERPAPEFLKKGRPRYHRF